jgi:dolichol-phosphate mannosyltransferase
MNAPTAPGPELTVVVPTRNERDNITPLYEALGLILKDVDWEVMFVDDDSSDGTLDAVRRLALRDRRVRLLHRIGRRGLASACVEGMQASTSPFIAVMDADLQHDESLLPRMLETLRSEPIDLVIGSRYINNGGIGDWDNKRARLSVIATQIGRYLLRVPVSDPMSGFFMFRRAAFEQSIRDLSAVGFKILIDLVASSPQPPRVKELPLQFRSRHAGESKFDLSIASEYLILLVDKLVGQILPIRFVMFSIVGAIGILAHVAILWLFLRELDLSFAVSQTAATFVAMVGNFALNNLLTYRDVRLAGWDWVKGLISFCLICGVGAVANVGVASFLFDKEHSAWWIAGIAGAAMGLVWNYALTSLFTWRRLS